MTRITRGRAAVVAGLLAGMACYSGYSARATERRNPPGGTLLDIGQGRRLHYVSSGHGRPVVLLHGASAQLQDMTASLMPSLEQRYEVFAFDRPGHGYSGRRRYRAWAEAQARTLHEAVRRLRLEKPVIVGHSMGGGVAMAYGFLYPNEISGVVFLSGLAFPEVKPDFLKFAGPAIPVIGSILSYTLYQPLQRMMLPSMLRRFFQPQAMPSRFRDEMPFGMLYRPKVITVNAEEQMMVVPSMIDLQQHYRDYPVPVFVLAGTEDQTTDPNKHALRLASVLPDVRLRMLPGLGHMIHHFAQGVIVDAVDDVFERADARRRSKNKNVHPEAGA